MLARTPVPPEWMATLDANVPYYRVLSPDEREELLTLTRIFVAEKNFEGAGGLEMTDEVRVTIAAQACLLLLGRETGIYPGLQSIIVYPEAYFAPADEYELDGTAEDGLEERSGESWHRGAVVLSWDDIMLDASNTSDGENIVLHEFAHQLDEESGEANGAPPLATRDATAEWAKVFRREYDRFARNVDAGRPTLMDEYAAESPAEFFAVATEFFFEMPAELRSKHPELYTQLRTYYRQDPASRLRAGKGS